MLRLSLLFESRVILDGSQTVQLKTSRDHWFESRVILDGSQTVSKMIKPRVFV